MEYEELVCQRRSIRGDDPDRVPREVVLEIVEVASGAPSPMGTQPWRAVVREHGTTAEDEVVMTRVAMGHPLEDLATNDVKATQVPADDLVTFVGFED